MADAIKEYLLLLKPMLDSKLLDSSLDLLQNLFKERAQKIKDDMLGILGDTDNKNREKQQKQQQKQKQKLTFVETLEAGTRFVKHLKSSFKQIAGVIEDTLDTAQEYLEKASATSNKFVTGSSIFVDSSVKEKMMNFGVSSTQAQSIIAAEEALGVSSSDYATMTEGQMSAFTELIEYYQEGLNSLDADKLEQYNNVMQEYQLSMAKINMSMQLAMQKLFVNSEPLQRLADKVLDFMEGIVDVLSSDAAQVVFDTFITFLENVIGILSMPLKLFSSSGTTNVDNSDHSDKSTNNNYYYGSSSSSSLLSYTLGTDEQIQ